MFLLFFFFKQKTAYDMRSSDWSSDVCSSDLSSRECLTAIRAHPGELLGAACIIDRSNGRADVGAPLVSLLKMDVPAYPADALPPDLAALPATKPGSRGLKK